MSDIFQDFKPLGIEQSYSWGSITNDLELENALYDVFGSGSLYLLEREEPQRCVVQDTAKLKVSDPIIYEREVAFREVQIMQQRQLLTQTSATERSINKSCSTLEEQLLKVQEATDSFRNQIELDCLRLTEVCHRLSTTLEHTRSSLAALSIVNANSNQIHTSEILGNQLEALYAHVNHGRKGSGRSSTDLTSSEAAIIESLQSTRIIHIKSELELHYLRSLNLPHITEEIDKEQIMALKREIADLMKELPTIIGHNTSKYADLWHKLYLHSREQTDNHAILQCREIEEIAKRSRTVSTVLQQILLYTGKISQKETALIEECISEHPLALDKLQEDVIVSHRATTLPKLPLMRPSPDLSGNLNVTERCRQDV